MSNAKIKHRSLARILAPFLFLMGLTEVAISQEFDNIERRLGGIVAEGDLSLEQATVMLHALSPYYSPRTKAVLRLEVWPVRNAAKRIASLILTVGAQRPPPPESFFGQINDLSCEALRSNGRGPAGV